LAKEEKVSRRGYVKYAGAGIVVVAVAGAGAYYATRPPATPTPTVMPTEEPTPTPTEKPTPTPTGIEVVGATPAERALNAARQYVELNNVPAGTKIVMTYVPGAGGHYKPEYLEAFEDACMGKVDVINSTVEIPHIELKAKYTAESVEKSGAYDVMTITPTAHMADYVEMGLVADIREYINKYNPEWDTGNCPHPDPVSKTVNSYRGIYYGSAIDYDVWLTCYNPDYIEDPNEQEAFEKQYGYPLRPPQTWQEYYDVSEFFYRPPDMYGTWSYKVLWWQLFEVKMRILSRGVWFFDDDMRPLINSKEAIEAIEDEIKAQKFQPPESYTALWDTAYDFYLKGKIPFLISWTSLKKFAIASGIGELCKAEFPPGYSMKDGNIRRCAFYAASHVFGINAHAEHPELAYLLLQYYTDPEVSEKIILDPAGFYEPFRTCHFTDPDVQKDWGADYLGVMQKNFDYFAQDPLAIKAAVQYDDILDKNINAILQAETEDEGIAMIEDKMNEVAAAWEEITDTMGRDYQASSIKFLKDGLGPKLAPYMDPNL
jgi:multiple sugar transport system substrate-binding protein